MMRKPVFANGFVYHVFNRAIDRRPIFASKKYCNRAAAAFDYYRFKNPPLKLCQAFTLPIETRKCYFESIKKLPKLVDILAYCLMPNHFHFLLRQKMDHGVVKFVGNFSNSYSRYFNTTKDRAGPLFESNFKAVLIETDEQLVHVSRYIHVNPVVSLIIAREELEKYPWSSYPEYLGLAGKNICETKTVLERFPSTKSYCRFVNDQIDYGILGSQTKCTT